MCRRLGLPTWAWQTVCEFRVAWVACTLFGFCSRSMNRFWRLANLFSRLNCLALDDSLSESHWSWQVASRRSLVSWITHRHRSLTACPAFCRLVALKRKEDNLVRQNKTIQINRRNFIFKAARQRCSPRLASSNLLRAASWKAIHWILCSSEWSYCTGWVRWNSANFESRTTLTSSVRSADGR